jgi:hypothetical protein
MRQRLGSGEPESYHLLCCGRRKCQYQWKWELRAWFLNSFLILRDHEGRDYHKSREHDSSGSVDGVDDAGSSVYCCGRKTLNWGGDGWRGDLGSGRIVKEGKLLDFMGYG